MRSLFSILLVHSSLSLAVWELIWSVALSFLVLVVVFILLLRQRRGRRDYRRLFELLLLKWINS